MPPSWAWAFVLALHPFQLISGTSYLPTDQLLSGVEDPDWFKANVPILEVPNANISQIYYFRWQTYKEHLFYTGPLFGYLSTEFLFSVDYGGPYGGIVAAAGHHIHEGRFLRNQKYGRHEVDYWLRGPGTWPKPVDEGHNPNSNDWAHEYSFWAASSVLAQAEATGSTSFATGHLANLDNQYNKWSPQFNSGINLYWQVPVWDATENTVASFETDPSDPYHGGAGYRPTINSYQYGDAVAIAQLGAIGGNSSAQSTYTSRANSLRQASQQILWDKSANFFKHCARDNNPNLALLPDREYMGYLPWQFNLPADGTDSPAFLQLQDPQGFQAPYGPTTAENRSSYFYRGATTNGCCYWDGPSWPYATAGVLAAAENLLNNYPQSSAFNATNYFNLLLTYTLTQYEASLPQVYEAHDAYGNFWIYKDPGRDDDYNHSTYVENIIAGLIGLRTSTNSTLIVNPLAPSTWAYFGLENVAYHGHNITVIWDSNNQHYKQGQGLRVYVDNKLANSSSTLSKLTVNVGSTIPQPINSQVNIAANPLSLPNAPNASATFTSGTGGGNGGDQAMHVIDGLVLRRGILENSRWTSFNSPNPSDTLTITFPRVNAFNNVNLYFYADGGGVGIPKSYQLQYRNATDGTWSNIPQQQQSGQMTNNARVQVTFPEISSSAIRITAPNPNPPQQGWGLSEVEVWTAPMFTIQNNHSQLLMGVDHISSQNGALIQQWSDNGTGDHIWQLIPQPGGWFVIQNYASKKALSVNGSKANSTNLVQEDVTGADDQLWRFQDIGLVDSNGNFISVPNKGFVYVIGQNAIYNKFSGLVAGVTNESTDLGANIVQYANTLTPDHLWSLVPAVPAGSSSVGS